jgi:hypothetical protein
VVLLLATCETDGASVAVDSKDSHVASTADKESKEAPHVDEQLDPRIGLYMQKVDQYGSVGPIGGNSAFYLLPSYGNFDLRPSSADNRCQWEAYCFLNGFNCVPFLSNLYRH